MKLIRCITCTLLLMWIALRILAQDGDASSVITLQYKLKQFQKKPGYQSDTNYIIAVTDLAYIYSYSYPDSALIILAGNAARCEAIGYNKGEANTYIITGDAYQIKGLYDTALVYFEKAYILARKNKRQDVLPLILNRIGIVHLNQGNYTGALGKFYESLKTAETIHDPALAGAAINNIAVLQFHQGSYAEAAADYRRRLKLAEQMSDTSSMSVAYNGIGEVYLNQKDLKQALQNLTIAYQLASKNSDEENLLIASLSLAETYLASDSLQKADAIFKQALALSAQRDNGTAVCNALIGLAKTYKRQGNLPLALNNGIAAWQQAEKMGHVQLQRDASLELSAIYEAMGDGLTALKYFRIYKTNSDSLNSIESHKAVAIEKAGYEFSKKEADFQRKASQQQWLITSAFIGLLLLVVILWVIIRSRNRLNKTNKELQEKNQIIQIQKSKTEDTLSKLKATQSQLIQSEKMASLGELTAGIAHEIQNPLNFVNNFSEVSNELIDEMNTELDRGDISEAKIIATDIKQNLEKINHHGKRADAIVKGMLQHSRKSEGQKEPTDINALCDEYLRLCYHGIHAKDKSFDATLNTDFNKTIGKINIIPQDIGRVIINLLTNAFYAVQQKQKELSFTAVTPFKKMSPLYEPTVSISTKKIEDKIEIRVEDNGNGIPQNIVDKIFQPFFTTKPTGQGSGLGLSLSYDIVKAHGGNLKVNIKDTGTQFTIQLPINNA